MLHDGAGLFLIVKPVGKKLWRFRYHHPAIRQSVTSLLLRLLMPQGKSGLCYLAS